MATPRHCALSDDPLWYKDAIVYEVHVKSFYDKNGDGIGDFQGLKDKLDYIQDLGITAIWLLPFYPSPLRDDGYDIADYMDVHPLYGTLDDFREFLTAAHSRGLRVITELVINHTSDQHPWFQRARNAPPHSVERDFYVWTDDSTKYGDARIIFTDTEKSNWTWDPVAKQYYWHRFFSHQPDLNFENPKVHQAIFDIVDFWLGMGIDGLRLDAVPYLYENDGTMCENLPETHEFLRQLRSHVDANFENRMLLAEANQWPETSYTYFGSSKIRGRAECHMAFHFPLMPRLWNAIKCHDTYPILDILEQTPEIPSDCQWAIFLRNHDELTLEMVTDEERDFMYRTYARDPKHRINVGIRRRLAPLLDKNTSEIKLLHALLLSLPGTPFLYYGDEILMGDNCDLPDRDGVRTPMQWNSSKNAGFTVADKTYLPVITSEEYHYRHVNVENSHNNHASFFWWLKKILAIRKQHTAVFGRGDIIFLAEKSSSSVLSFLRTNGPEVLLLVFNLSTTARFIELDLSNYKGWSVQDIIGNVDFPPVGDSPYMITLSSHSFFWFKLYTKLSPSQIVPKIFMSGSAETIFVGNSRSILESVLLPYLERQPYFNKFSKSAITGLNIMDVIPLHRTLGNSFLVLSEVKFDNLRIDTYLVPVQTAFGKYATEVQQNHPHKVIGNIFRFPSTMKTPINRKRKPIPEETETGILFDASQDPVFAKLLLLGISCERKVAGERGFSTSKMVIPVIDLMCYDITSAEQLSVIADPVEFQDDSRGFSLIRFSNQFSVKLHRYLGTSFIRGVHPDYEIRLLLTETLLLQHPGSRSSFDGIMSRVSFDMAEKFPSLADIKAEIADGNTNGERSYSEKSFKIPWLYGGIHYRGHYMPLPITLATVENSVKTRCTVQEFLSRDVLPKFFEMVTRKNMVPEAAPENPQNLDFNNIALFSGTRMEMPKDPEFLDQMEKSRKIARSLAKTVAELHITLANLITSLTPIPTNGTPTTPMSSAGDFGRLHSFLNWQPEPFNTLYQRALYQSIRNTIRSKITEIKKYLGKKSTDIQYVQKLYSERISWLINNEKMIMSQLDSNLLSQNAMDNMASLRIRIHGDLSLDHMEIPETDIDQISPLTSPIQSPQLPRNPSSPTSPSSPSSPPPSTELPQNYVLRDFSGVATKPLSERRIKNSPLKDVATLLLSLYSIPFIVVQQQVQQQSAAQQPEQQEQKQEQVSVQQVQQSSEIQKKNEVLWQWANFWAKFVGVEFVLTYFSLLHDEHQQHILRQQQNKQKEQELQEGQKAVENSAENQHPLIPLSTLGASLLLNALLIEISSVKICEQVKAHSNTSTIFLEILEKLCKKTT